MPKGAIEERRAATELVRLRDKIRELEIGVANIRGRGKGVADLLRLRDEVEEGMRALSEDEAAPDLRPERTRMDTIDNMLLGRAPHILGELMRFGGLAAARGERPAFGGMTPLETRPADDHWWWYLDEYVAQRRRKAAIKTIAVVMGLVAVLLVGNWVMNRYFGLDPVEREARGYTMEAEQLFRSGDLEGAIAAYEKALTVVPSMEDALVMLGVLYEVTGRQQESEEVLARAREAIGKRSEYLLILSRSYMDVGEMEKAMAAVQEAIALDPESAQAYLIRATIYESQNEVALALEDLEKSGSLAQAQGQDSLYVLSRMRMAMLLQRGPASSMPGQGF